LASSAHAQDLVIMQDGRQMPGKVLGASASGLQIQIGQGSVTLPMATLKEVRMATIPPEFAAAQKALIAKDYNGALAALRALDKYKGLPTDWAQQAAGMVGDVYVELGQVDQAEAAYKEAQRLYPGAQGGPQSDLGQARLAVAKKDFETAKQHLEPIATKALQEKNVPPGLGSTYSQTFYLLGQAKEASGDLPGALESYLRTVTLFYQDRAAVAQAQAKADGLRKAHPDVFVP
jgi:predicted Zn-dependent protease